MEMVEHVTPVPNAPAFVEGVVFSRGQVVPVINLRVRFGFERAALDLRTRLLVVQDDRAACRRCWPTRRASSSRIADAAIQPPQRGDRRSERQLSRRRRDARRANRADSESPRSRRDGARRGGSVTRLRRSQCLQGEWPWQSATATATAHAHQSHAALRDEASQITDAVSRIAEMTDQVSEGADAQMRSLDSALSGVNQMSASLKETATQAESVAASTESLVSSINEVAASIEQVTRELGKPAGVRAADGGVDSGEQRVDPEGHRHRAGHGDRGAAGHDVDDAR